MGHRNLTFGGGIDSNSRSLWQFLVVTQLEGVTKHTIMHMSDKASTLIFHGIPLIPLKPYQFETAANGQEGEKRNRYDLCVQKKLQADACKYVDDRCAKAAFLRDGTQNICRYQGRKSPEKRDATFPLRDGGALLYGTMSGTLVRESAHETA